jgi:hypothetical protein
VADTICQALFRPESDYLIGEQVRDLRDYLAIPAAIAKGARRPAEIALPDKMPGGSHTDPYLSRLVEVIICAARCRSRFNQKRRIPATLYGTTIISGMNSQDSVILRESPWYLPNIGVGHELGQRHQIRSESLNRRRSNPLLYYTHDAAPNR